MADRNPQDFDPTRQLAMTRGARLNGHDLGQFAPVRVVEEPTDARGEITDEVARRLWAAGQLDYADELVATPVEDPQTGVAALVEVDQLGGGWFQIRAPWLTEAIKVQGAEAAEEERQATIKQGLGQIDLRRPPQDELFTIAEVGSNGWFEVSGPGLTEPLKIRGEQAAMSKRDELARQAATPPPGPGGTLQPPPQPDAGADRTTDDETAGAGGTGAGAGDQDEAEE